MAKQFWGAVIFVPIIVSFYTRSSIADDTSAPPVTSQTIQIGDVKQQPPKVEIIWSLAFKRMKDRFGDYMEERREKKQEDLSNTKVEKDIFKATGWNDKPRPLEKFDLLDKTKTELTDVFQALTRPGDPPLKIVIRPSPMNFSTNHLVFPGQGSEIWMGVGALAFTKDINELAGLIALEMANVRKGYDRALAQHLAILKVKESSNPKAAIAFELKEIALNEKQGKPVDQDRKRLLNDTNQLLDVVDSQKTRDRVELEALRQLRVNVDVSDQTKQRILAAKDAIDRMVAAGFDPWKFLDPWKKVRRVEEAKLENIGEAMRRLVGAGADTRETVNLEMEFGRTYIAYLEKKKVNFLQQPYRGVQLPTRLTGLHFLATAAQTVTLQGVAKYYAGAGGTVAAGGVYLYAGNDAKKVVSEKADEAKSKITATQIGGLAAMGTTVAIVGGGIEMGARSIAFGVRQSVGMFPSRYVHAVQDSNTVSEKIDELRRSTTTDSKTVIEALDAYEKSTVFLSDGLTSDIDRSRARQLYIMRFQYPKWSLLSIINRSENMALRKDPAVAALLGEAEEAAKVEIIKRQGTFDIKRDRKKLAKETEVQFKKLFIYGAENISDRKISLSSHDDRNAVDSSNGAQRLLFNLFGGYSRHVMDSTTEKMLALADQHLSGSNTKSGEKEAVLEKLATTTSLQYLGTKNQESYLKIMDRHFPQYGLLSKPMSEIRDMKKQIPESVYRTLLSYKMGQTLSPDDVFIVLKELKAAGRYFQAAKLVLRRFDSLVQRNGRDTYQLIREILEFSPRDFGHPAYKRLVTNAIMTKAFLTLNSAQKAALWSHLKDASSVPITTHLVSPAVRVLTEVLQRPKSKNETVQDRIDRLDTLNHVGATPRFLYDRLWSEVANTSLSNQDIKAILDREHFWMKFNPEAIQQHASSVDKSIYSQYSKLASQYDTFSYDPKTSEAAQKILLSEFRRNNPAATIDERLKFWERLVSRGATGLTDGVFEELFRLVPASQKRQVAESAFTNHQIWDKNLSAEIYREINRTSFNDKTLEQKATATITEIKAKLKSFPLTGSKDERVQKANELLAQIAGELAFVSNDDKKSHKQIEKLVSRLATTDPSSPQGESAMKGAQQAVDRYIEANSADTIRHAKLGFLESHKSELVKQFSEGGPVLVDLLDWSAKNMQTNREQTGFIKKQIMVAEGVKNSDLGYSVTNAIVEGAVNWDREEKWALVRWLRGNGPPPPALSEQFRTVGEETVRRLYTGMPIHVRRVFMAALIDSTKRSLLRGGQSLLFQEQLLNELLPAKEKTADIAQDLIRAFLKSVDQVSSPEKKTLVISHLLANHQEKNANSGAVLRNVLEAYGPVGVKFGQLLAASDVLPPDVRKELAKLRDGANVPRLYEIYEDLERILKTNKTDSLLSLKKLLGSASMKYGIQVEERATGETHVLQVAREETRVSIPMDLKQLQIIIDDLIKRNAGRYSFLMGIGNAVQDGTLRELSLVKETEKSAIAKSTYENLKYANDVDLTVPKTTTLVERLPGPNTKIHAMRSSVFVDGQPFDSFSQKDQVRFAEVILAAEKQILYFEPALRDGRPNLEEVRPFDPDRHPGNNLMNNKNDRVQYMPIDWGQLLNFLTPNLRSRVEKMMAFSQVLERVGPLDSLMKNFATEFGFNEKQMSALQKELFNNFPNRDSKPRSALSGYYYLLAKMEKQGFERNIVHYDFVKAIYQLEAYEELLKGKAHESPKAIFAKNVEDVAKEYTSNIEVKDREKIALAIRRPWTTGVIKENVERHTQGKLTLSEFLGHLELSQKAIQSLLKAYPDRNSAQLPATGEDLVKWLSKAAHDNKELSKSDSARVASWLESPKVEQVIPESLTAEEFLKLAKATPVAGADAFAKARKTVQPPPILMNPILSTGSIYAAELINAVFWSIWERNPKLAESWISQMMTFEKHAGFAAFAVAAHTYDRIFTRSIPMSLQYARFISGKGVSMAVGMMASDIAHRVLNGQSMGEIIDHEFSGENLSHLGYATLAFMAAEKVVSETKNLKSRITKTSPNTCPGFFSRIAHLGAVFVTAEALQKLLKPSMTDLGLLPVTAQERIEQANNKYLGQFQNLTQQIDQLYRSKPCSALNLIFASRTYPPDGSRISHASYESYQIREYYNKRPTAQEQSIRAVLQGYKNEMNAIRAVSKDTHIIRATQEQVQQVENYLATFLQEKVKAAGPKCEAAR